MTATMIEEIRDLLLAAHPKDYPDGSHTTIGKICIEANWAIANVRYGKRGGGQALLERKDGGWEIVAAGGGVLAVPPTLSRLGVPKEIADKLDEGMRTT